MILALVLVSACAQQAMAQIRVVTYNIAQLQGNVNDLEDVLIALHDDDRSGFAAPVSVFVFQEVVSGNIATLESLVNAAAPVGTTYAMGTYTNSSEDDYAGAQAMFYRSDLLTEDTGAHADIWTGAGRLADRWKLELLDYSSPDASFYIYSMHLKAGTDPSDASQRATGAAAVRSNAASLPAGSHIIYAGDFNVDHNGEAAYWEFLDPGAAQAFDPLGTSSWSGSGGAIKHTQSPRASSSSGGLIGGGMDDRFDFQLPSLSLNDGSGLALIGGTYRTVANDGQHYNTSVNNGDNFYFGVDTARSNALADACFDASDHLPVMCEYTIPAVMNSWTNITDVGRVIVGANVEVELMVANDADVVAGDGADSLNFDVVTTGDMLGSISSQVSALAPPATFDFPADTSSVGPISGSIDVSSTDEAVENPSDSHLINGEALRHAVPSFSDSVEQGTIDVMANVTPDSGVIQLGVDVWNLGFDASQALLDIDSIVGLTPPLSYAGTAVSGIASLSETLTFDFDTAGLSEGLIQQTATVNTSDEDLPGESSHSLSIIFEITVAAAPCDADVTGDAVVDVQDLLAVLGEWGTPAGDTNDDGTTDVADLLNVLGAWGSCP